MHAQNPPAGLDGEGCIRDRAGAGGGGRHRGAWQTAGAGGGGGWHRGGRKPPQRGRRRGPPRPTPRPPPSIRLRITPLHGGRAGRSRDRKYQRAPISPLHAHHAKSRTLDFPFSVSNTAQNTPEMNGRLLLSSSVHLVYAAGVGQGPACVGHVAQRRIARRRSGRRAVPPSHSLCSHTGPANLAPSASARRAKRLSERTGVLSNPRLAMRPF